MRIIDADALKYKNLAEINGRLTFVFTPEEIDDAPTVETSKIEHKAYNEGFKDGVDQGIRLSQTPGEWLWLCDTPNAKYKWACNKCGRGVKEQENYCSNCGADMRKGGNK